jgi:hypothetical protein
MVRVHYDEGVAPPIGPEPCGSVREAAGEASIGEHAGQHGHRERWRTMAATSLRRMVAIEFGIWRSVLNGGAAGSETRGKGRRLEVRGSTRS